MIVKCRICGREFKGRANASICSAACRAEARKEYQKKYRMLYPNKVKARQRKWWAENRAAKPEIKSSDNLDLKFNSAPKESKPKRNTTEWLKEENKKYEQFKKLCERSEWGKQYYNADRITEISMLSGELSKYDIAHLSYGSLSTLWNTGRYEALLHKVLRIKEQEEKRK